MEKVIKSNCRGCHGGCGVLVTVKNGRITKLEENPGFPTDHGAMCSHGLSFLQFLYRPDRVLLLPISEMGHFLNRTLWHNQVALTSSLRPWL